jgi:hypothetical protein
MLRRLIKTIALVAALGAVFVAAEAAHAVGYWNVPGSTCQWWGYGCGAGYHAKFVLGPITVHGACAHNEVRLPYAPQPPYGYCGYNGCGCVDGQPSVLEPMVQPGYYSPAPVHGEQSMPALEPEPLELAPEAPPTDESSSVSPATAPRNALFGPPVER